MQQLSQKKNNKSLSYVFLLGLAVVIVAGIVRHFWPDIKGLWSTTQAVLVLTRDVSLTGIFYSEDNPVAIVDGKMVHEQDTIGDVKVRKIHKHKVEFETSDRRWSQTMLPAEEGVTSGRPVLLELGSPKCPACKKMKPILDKLRKKYTRKFQIRYIDVWKDTDAGSQYGVRAIPTLIFYDSNGNELFRHVGFLPKKDILDIWKQLGYDF